MMDLKMEDSSSGAQVVSKSAAEDVWTEARLSSSLARLQEMHIQLRQLRETIPELIRVIHAEHSSPTNLYAELSRVATDAVADIKDFTEYAQDSKTQEILKKAKEAKGNDDSGGVTNWVVAQHSKWLEKPMTAEYQKPETEVEDMDGDKTLLKASAVDPTAVVDEFREGHPDVDVVLDQESQKIKLNLPQARLNFEISLEPDPKTKAKAKYTVSCKETLKLHTLILQSISQRQKPDDLLLLLEMLSSYANLRSKPCEKCNRPLDRNAQRPAVRKYTGWRWQVLHTACAAD